MKHVNKLTSVKLTGKVGEKRARQEETSRSTWPAEIVCESWDVKEKLTTATLDVPGVEVVTESAGKAIVGPFYPDELTDLQEALRQMPKRERHIVVATEQSAWIHRKP